MAEETGRQYFLQFFEGTVKKYEETYLKRWTTPEKLDEVENMGERDSCILQRNSLFQNMVLIARRLINGNY